MSQRRRNLLLVLIVALALGLFGVLSLVLSTPDVAPPVVTRADPAAAPAVAEQDTSAIGRQRTELSGEEAQPVNAEPTTVVFPLKIELELMRAEATLQAEGQVARGSDATARLKGMIADSGGGAVRARIEVLAGPNRGRIFNCDARGQFGVNDLYPGRVLLDITGPNIAGSQREAILRKDRETLLNIGYGRPANVIGEVVDADGKGIDGVSITMDGQRTLTDTDGVFTFPFMTAGEVVILVDKPGYASVFQLLTITAGSNVERGRIKFRMARGAKLQLTIPENINSGEPATVIVLPASLAAQRSYPWWRINPVTTLYPGGTITIEDLPLTRLSVRHFHAGAIAKPMQQEVALDPIETTSIELHLEPAPIVFGVVTLDGKPESGAEVTLEVPGRIAATLGALGETSELMLETEVMPDLPLAVQVAHTTATGEYQLSANEQVSKARYLVARSRDGRHQAAMVLHGGETKVDLALQPVGPSGGGPCEFILQTSPRHQSLPVEVVVNGTPRDPLLLPSERDLHIGELVKGRWRVRVRWEDIELLPPTLFDLTTEVTQFVKLPEGAVVGQDDETRRRARRP